VGGFADRGGAGLGLSRAMARPNFFSSIFIGISIDFFC
jgi:hypothetical protein